MGKHSVKNKKGTKKAKNNNKKILIFLAIIFIILAIIIVKKSSQPNNKDEISLIIDNENLTQQLENEIIIQDDITYISLNDVKKCLDTDIYQEDEKIIISGDKKIAVLKIDDNNVEINGANIDIKGQAFKTDEDIIYLPISELQNVYDIEFSYIPESKNIIIDYYSQSLEKAYVTKNISVKSEMNGFSETISKIKKGNWVVFVSEENGWAKVRTQQGELGYIKSKYLTNFVKEREEMQETNRKLGEEFLEKDISSENLEKYENRKEIIEQLLLEAVSNNYKSIKIIYKEDKTNEQFKRFEIESSTILKECGINIEFE